MSSTGNVAVYKWDVTYSRISKNKLSWTILTKKTKPQRHKIELSYDTYIRQRVVDETKILAITEAAIGNYKAVRFLSSSE